MKLKDCTTKYFETTALIQAAENGHKETVKLLLESNADINVNDDLQNTALMKAALKGHRGVVEILLHLLQDKAT